MSLAEIERELDRSAPTGYGQTNTDPPTVEVNRKTPRLHLREQASSSESETVGQLMVLFDQARSKRRPMVSQWKQSYRMVRNQYWNTERQAWRPSPQIPEIFPIVDALVSWEGDQDPQYTVSPMALPHTEYQQMFQTMSNDLEIVLRSSFDNNDEISEWAKADWDKYVYGTGIVKTTWDMTLSSGIGDAITRRVDPFTFYPDPNATSLKDANYMVEARNMSAQEMERRWPGSSVLFEQNASSGMSIDEAPTQLGGSGDTKGMTNPVVITPGNPTNVGVPTRGPRLGELPEMTVLEFWLREPKNYKADDLNTGEKTTKTFDKWRVMIVAGNRLIMDEPVDNLWSHGKHPYDRLVVRDTGEFWGFSLVALLTSAQTGYNRILASLQQNVELAGNPVFKDVGTSGRTALTSKPGTRMQVPIQGKDSSWLQPPQLSPAMPSLMNHYLQRMEAVSGLTAVMKGASPSGRNAQGVIDALQEAGFVRIRSSLKFREATMRSAGEKKADLICENYTRPRLIAIAGPGMEKTSMALKARHFLIPTSSGAIPMKYQMLIDVGSSRHTSRQMREDRAIQLYTIGAIDEEALMSDINYPNGAEVAKRVEGKKAAEAMAEPNTKTKSRA